MVKQPQYRSGGKAECNWEALKLPHTVSLCMEISAAGQNMHYLHTPQGRGQTATGQPSQHLRNIKLPDVIICPFRLLSTNSAGSHFNAK